MFTDEELNKMMNGEGVPASEPQEAAQVADESQGPETEPNTDDPVAEGGKEDPDADPDPASEAPATEEAPTGEDVGNVMSKENSVAVSTVILENVDKHIKMTLANSNIRALNANCDLVNYIVYVNTDKNIPCVYDCKGLRIPTASVKNADGTWKVTSVEGRRSGFVIKCGTERHLVMTKNFIYDCVLDANGNIQSVTKYDRKNTMTPVTETATSEYDVATIYVQKVLPKIVKCGKYTTIETLREQVKVAYDKVDDVNALFKIIDLRLQIGC